MKHIYGMIILGILFILSACETDNKKYYAGNFIAPELEVPAAGSKIVLTEATADSTLFFEWRAADFGFPSATIYTIQVARAGTYFESAVKIAETKDTDIKVKYSTLNNSVLIAGLVPETPAEVEIRVNATINNHIETLYSKAVELTLTAYNINVTYPILYVPGSYQGWNPGDPFTVVTSPKANEVYEGYFYFPANTEFKFTAQPAWDPKNWGEGGNGKLQAGGGNIQVSQAGFYEVIADIPKLTYSITLVNWSVTGSAIPNHTMTLQYNETEKVLETTTDLATGEFVFRETGGKNRTLGVYFGSQLTDDGTQIVIPQDGRYKIVLDLKTYPYTFRVVTENL